MGPRFYYNQGTGRSYIDATKISCDDLESANISADNVKSATLTGTPQNALPQTVVDYTASQTTANALYVINKPNLSAVAISGNYADLSSAPNLSNFNTTTVTSTGNISGPINATTIAASGNTALKSLSATRVTTPVVSLAGGLAGSTQGLTTFQQSVGTITSLHNNTEDTANTFYAGGQFRIDNRPQAFGGDAFRWFWRQANATSLTQTAALSNVGAMTVASSLSVPTVTTNTIVLPNANFTGQYGELKGLPGTQTATPANISVLQANTATIDTATVNGNLAATRIASQTLYAAQNLRIEYNPNFTSLQVGGQSDLGFTRFLTPPGFPCPTATFTNFGQGPAGNVNPANTVTTQLNFSQYAQQAGFIGAMMQVRDDGLPVFVNNAFVRNPSAYIAFQTGGADRLVVGNAGVVSVPGTISTSTVTQTAGSFLSRYQLNTNVTIPANATVFLNTWPTTATTIIGAAAPVGCDGTNFTINRSGVYSVIAHVRFSATATENSAIFTSNSGTWGNSKINQANTSAYDPNAVYTGFFAQGDVLTMQAFSTVANSVLANQFGVPTYIQFVLLTPTA